MADAQPTTLILTLDINANAIQFEQVVQTYMAGEWSNADIMLTVYGYDDDPREIWQIPEAADYLRLFYHAVKLRGATFENLDDVSWAILLYVDGQIDVEWTDDINYRFIVPGAEP